MCTKPRLQAQTKQQGWVGESLLSQGRLILWLPTEAEMLLSPLWMVHYTHCYTNWPWSADECSAFEKEHTEIQNCRWF